MTNLFVMALASSTFFPSEFLVSSYALFSIFAFKLMTWIVRVPEGCGERHLGPALHAQGVGAGDHQEDRFHLV